MSVFWEMPMRCVWDSGKITAMKMLILSFASQILGLNLQLVLRIVFAATSISPVRCLSYRFWLIDYRSGRIERRAIRFEPPTPSGFFPVFPRDSSPMREGYWTGRAIHTGGDGGRPGPWPEWSCPRPSLVNPRPTIR